VNDSQTAYCAEREKRSRKTGLESDVESISDLTELSEDLERTSPRTSSSPKKTPITDTHPTPAGSRQVGNLANAEDAHGNDLNNTLLAPEDLVEWETVCGV
jgi:hypothetical protein